MWFFLIIAFLLALWIIAEKKLAPPNYSHFDGAIGETFAEHADDQEATAEVLNTLARVRIEGKESKSLKKGLAIAREFADNLSANFESDCEFKSVIANGVPSEWAIAPNADHKRRVLLFHGGAFLLGSPKGHRIFAHHLSHLAKAAVLSVDYRMIPENKRMASVEDARSTYHYILTQGPDGETPLEKLVVAGDSAGGNLALMISHWSRANAARQPDAILGVAPSLDSTLDSPTVVSNLKTDKVLGEAFGLLSKLPKALALWVGVFLMRANPSDPSLSPLFDDLNNIPPTLLHASSSECLLGDSIRYANKASVAGVDVKLQIWENQLHDFHIFTPNSGSGKEAWSEVGKFFDEKLG